MLYVFAFFPLKSENLVSMNRVPSPLVQGPVGRALCLFHSRYVSPVLMSGIHHFCRLLAFGGPARY